MAADLTPVFINLLKIFNSLRKLKIENNFDLKKFIIRKISIIIINNNLLELFIMSLFIYSYFFKK